jgi:hypothetical protein
LDIEQRFLAQNRAAFVVACVPSGLEALYVNDPRSIKKNR